MGTRQGNLAASEEYLPVPLGDLEHTLELVRGWWTGRRSYARTACLPQKPLDLWATDHHDVHVICGRISEAVHGVRGNERHLTGGDMEKFRLTTGKTHDF